MSTPPETQRAIEWMEAQLAELSGIRNATARDPSFKNWRQATLTVMQRIWPGDQDRSERFRRIPFSPADPRADARTLREGYSRGCQEAARVLNGFVTEIREFGVPETSEESLPQVPVSEFEDGFPTVDLPAGDLGASSSPADIADNLLADMADAPPQGSDPQSPVPPRLPVDVPPAAPVPEPVATFVAPAEPEPIAPQVAQVEIRPAKKGIGMKARLRDLLGFAHLSAKALAGFPREPEPGSESQAQAPAPAPPAASTLGMQPLGDDVVPAPLPPRPVLVEPSLAAAPPKPEWPVLSMHAEATPQPPEAVVPVTPTLPPAAVEAIDAELPSAEMRTEPGASFIMSKPTTLRGKVEKVSIESLISAEFRSTGADGATEDVAPPAPPPPPAPPEAIEPVRAPAEPAPAPVERHAAELEPPPTARPALKLVRPFVGEPEFNVEPAPSSKTTAQSAAVPEPAPPPTPSAPVRPEKPKPPVPAKVTPLPIRSALPPPEPEEEIESELVDDAPPPRTKSDSEAAARATDDFMRSSPVLGATSRRVKRGFDDSGFGDPDAIAVTSMLSELARMGVPEERQPEVRARLLDLARRLERGELEWGGLRKAVWFAMEYPEIARRLMPVLLPWIDRAS